MYKLQPYVHNTIYNIYLPVKKSEPSSNLRGEKVIKALVRRKGYFEPSGLG